jgi:hypothetical protein
MGERGRQPQTRGRRGGTAAREGGQPCLVQRIEGAPAGVIMEMTRLHARGNEARERLVLGKMGHEIALLVEKAQTVKHHGFDRMAGGHNPPFRVVLRRLIHDCRDAECCKHARDQTQVISDLRAVRLRHGREVRAVRVSHSLLLGRGIVSAPKSQ